MFIGNVLMRIFFREKREFPSGKTAISSEDYHPF